MSVKIKQVGVPLLRKLKAATQPANAPDAEQIRIGLAKRGTPNRIANMRTRCGFQDRGDAIFRDRNGNPISNAEVIREVDEGWRYFWAKRGRMPSPPERKFLV